MQPPPPPPSLHVPGLVGGGGSCQLSPFFWGGGGLGSLLSPLSSESAPSPGMVIHLTELLFSGAAARRRDVHWHSSGPLDRASVWVTLSWSLPAPGVVADWCRNGGGGGGGAADNRGRKGGEGPHASSQVLPLIAPSQCTRVCCRPGCFDSMAVSHMSNGSPQGD